jgi:hypothetical protein
MSDAGNNQRIGSRPPNRWKAATRGAVVSGGLPSCKVSENDDMYRSFRHGRLVVGLAVRGEAGWEEEVGPSEHIGIAGRHPTADNQG